MPPVSRSARPRRGLARTAHQPHPVGHDARDPEQGRIRRETTGASRAVGTYRIWEAPREPTWEPLVPDGPGLNRTPGDESEIPGEEMREFSLVRSFPEDGLVVALRASLRDRLRRT